MNIKIFKTSVILSFIAGIRAVLGVTSQIIIAYNFGTSRELDIYFVVFALPTVALGVVMTLFSSNLVPYLMHIKDDHEKLKCAVSSTLFYTFVMSLSFGLLGIFLGRQILDATTHLSSQDMLIAGNIVIIMWLIVAVQTINNFLISLYHLHKVFVFPAITSFSPVIGMIIGVSLFSHRIGVLAIAVGWLSMDILACILLMSTLFKYNLISFAKISFANEYAVKFLNNVTPTAISILPFTILPSMDAYWCSGLASGSMSYIGYSTRIINAIAVLITTGIYTVILPHLSENFKNNQPKQFFDNIQFSLKGVAFILFPATSFCLIYRQSILAVLLQRGQFSETSTHAIANLLPFYLFGMVAMCLSTLINRAYFAEKRLMRLGGISLVLMAIYFAMSGYLSSVLSYTGIGVAYMIYWFLFFFATTLCFDRSILGSDFVKYIAKLAINSIVALAISYLVCPIANFPSLLSGIITCSVVTFVAFYVMNAYVLKTIQPFKLCGK